MIGTEKLETSNYIENNGLFMAIQPGVNSNPVRWLGQWFNSSPSVSFDIQIFQKKKPWWEKNMPNYQ